MAARWKRFQLCKSMNRTAAVYFAEAKKANKEVKAPTATPDCVDPGAFVYPPPAAGAAPAAPAPGTGGSPRTCGQAARQEDLIASAAARRA